MSDLNIAKKVFYADTYTFVIVKAGQVIETGTRDGIGELLMLVAMRGETLRGAALADKIVGKAVAMVAAHAGFTAIYSPLMSEPAVQVLRAQGIPFESDRTVPFIQNKRGDGLCPMEQLTLALTEPAEAVQALEEFTARRRIAAAIQI